MLLTFSMCTERCSLLRGGAAGGAAVFVLDVRAQGLDAEQDPDDDERRQTEEAGAAVAHGRAVHSGESLQNLLHSRRAANPSQVCQKY